MSRVGDGTVLIPLIQAAVIDFGERGHRKTLETTQKVEALLTASLSPGGSRQTCRNDVG